MRILAASGVRARGWGARPNHATALADALMATSTPISGASSGGCCSLGLRYGARGAGDEPFLLASHRVGEPQGAGARLPGVYFQRGLFFAVACYYFCARRRGRSVARRSSCVARALRGGLWRRRFCQSGRRVARREVVALRGGLWRRRRFCQSASRARCGAVCGGGGGLWRQSVAAGAVCGEKK